MAADISTELEHAVAGLTRDTYLSMACVVRSRLTLPGLTAPIPAGARTGTRDAYAADTGGYLGELLAGLRSGGAQRLGSEWLLEVPAPLSRLRNSPRGELRCTVHRTDNDLVVAMIGLFGAAEGPLLDPEPVREHGREGRMRKHRNAYEYSFSFDAGLAPDSPAARDALRSLDLGFEKYLRILAGFRGEYVHPLNTMSRGEVIHLSRSVDETKKREEIRQKQDEFLDAYLDWKANHRISERTRLIELARQLQELDPSFQFSTLE